MRREKGRSPRGALALLLRLTSHFSLLTSHFSLLTAHCSLLTAHCLLPTAVLVVHPRHVVFPAYLE